ncbi:MAG: hypothetical protein KGO94_07140 [Alphaproteobacteria bacterium]|nr:hypothetical protein [Alphaproteobacteria bacterium]
MQKLLKPLFLAGVVLGALSLPAVAKPGDSNCAQNPQSPHCFDLGKGAGGPPPNVPLFPRRDGGPSPHANGGDQPSGQVDWPPRRHRPGYWPDGGRWGGDRWHQPGRMVGPQFFFDLQLEPNYQQYSYATRCERLGNSLRRSGFRYVRALSCSGRIYVYAARRDGDDLRISINRNTGRITQIRSVQY